MAGGTIQVDALITSRLPLSDIMAGVESLAAAGSGDIDVLVEPNP